MRIFSGLALLLAALFVHGCGKKETTTVESSPALAPVNYVGAAVKGEQSAVKTIDVVSINQALQLFNVQEGHYPKTLDELVTQKYLPQLPQVPPGMKLDYDPAQGKATISKP
ncbi:MAG TPA: hypothetical protein VHB20_07670 [Verrucomicrobiae bacterium]|jgi:hypothetical protein|nr:hypothetical protein [Verrucomicrobiae bacterium]